MILASHGTDLLRGLLVTLEVTLAGLVLAVVIGLALAICRVVPFRPARLAATAYVEFFRNIPPLIHLYFFFFALPRAGIVLTSFECGVLGLAMYHASYVAEILRAGILAIGPFQMQAGRALGLSYAGTMRYVILPQAAPLVIAPLGNLFVSLFKTSALVATIGVADLMYQGELLNEQTFRTFEVFAVVGAVYLVLSLAFGSVFARLETALTRRRSLHVA